MSINSFVPTFKITSSAKLAGLKGSLVAKKRMSDRLFVKFYHEVNDSFNRQSGISEGRIKEIFNKLIPNINLEIFPRSKEMEFAGGVGIICDSNGNIIGYRMCLPLVDGVLKKDSAILALFHEAKHFFDFITNPKLTWRAYCPYKKHLKTDRNHQLTTMLNSESFFEKNVHPGKDVMVSKQDIADFFDNRNLSKLERMDILNEFRAHLKMEEDAHTYDYPAMIKTYFSLSYLFKKYKKTEPIKILEIKTLVTEAKKILSQERINQYSFADKIKIIQEMMLEISGKEELFNRLQQKKVLKISA